MPDTLFAHTRTIRNSALDGHAGRWTLRALIGIPAVALLAVTLGGTATAQPGQTDDDTTTANVEVSSTIALTGLTESFTLSGLPGATVTALSAVTMNVETNNSGGYTVTVQSQTATLAPAVVTNVDSVPIGALSVRETGTLLYTPLSSTAAVPVHTQAVRSAEGGDDLSNDYQVIIPFVNEDTYSATLDYIATTL